MKTIMEENRTALETVVEKRDLSRYEEVS